MRKKSFVSYIENKERESYEGKSFMSQKENEEKEDYVKNFDPRMMDIFVHNIFIA